MLSTEKPRSECDEHVTQTQTCYQEKRLKRVQGFATESGKEWEECGRPFGVSALSCLIFKSWACIIWIQT